MKGFTLIELLVVVLIIGILAAVALPQYEKAVSKSRTTEAMIVVKTIAQAAEVFSLEAGVWPTSFDELAVSIPGRLGKWRMDNDMIITQNYKYVLGDGRVDAAPKNWTQNYPGILYVSHFAQEMKAPVAGKKLYCYVRTEATSPSKLESICKSLGGGERKSVTEKSIWFSLE